MNLQQLVSGLLPAGRIDLSNLDIVNQPVTEITPGEFISGENIFVFAGPPLLEQAVRSQDYLLPVGTCTVLNLQEQKQYLSWEEFGYKYTRHVPNKIAYAFSINKINTTQGDILHSFYAWAVKFMADAKRNTAVFTDAPGMAMGADSTDITRYNQFTNFGSEFFNSPFGILLAVVNNYYDLVKAQYIECCKFPARSTLFQAGGPGLEEAGQILCTRVRPAVGIRLGTKAKKPFTIAPPPSAVDASNAANRAEDETVLDNLAHKPFTSTPNVSIGIDPVGGLT